MYGGMKNSNFGVSTASIVYLYVKGNEKNILPLCRFSTKSQKEKTMKIVNHMLVKGYFFRVIA